MTEEDVALLVTLLLTAAVAGLVALGLVALLRRLARKWKVTVLSGRLWQSPVVLVVVFSALQRVVEGAARSWSESVDHLLEIGSICGVAWLLIVLVRTTEKAALAKYPDTGLRDERSRHVRTKITLLQRVATAAIVTIAIGVILWTIPQVRAVGATVLASAGVLSIIAGLAAQTTLSNIFAGVQIAFTDGIRVGDIVVVENVQGRIEEITLTYIVVRVWDGTRIILPCTYFTTTPFRNWSHSLDSVIGQVRVACDWSAPLDALRSELTRILEASPMWDRAVDNLVVDDATGSSVIVLAQFSAAPDTVELLRFEVREGLVRFLSWYASDSFPRVRQEILTRKSAAADPTPPGPP